MSDNNSKKNNNNDFLKAVAQVAIGGFVAYMGKQAWDNRKEIKQGVEAYLGIPFMILGARGVGKTSLFELIRNGITSLPEDSNIMPTQMGGRSLMTAKIEVGKSINMKPTLDLGGDNSIIENEWEKSIKEIKPMGVIFMLDYDPNESQEEQVSRHKFALNFATDVLLNNPENRKHLRTFHLLVNKHDIWGVNRKPESLGLDGILNLYRENTYKIRQTSELHQIQYKEDSISIRKGTNTGVAIKEFFDSVTRV